MPPAARPALAAGKSPEFLQEAVPLVVEESDVSLLPKAPLRLFDEENGEVDHSVPGRPNGSAQVKTARRFTVAARPARRPHAASGLHVQWPLAEGAGARAGSRRCARRAGSSGFAAARAPGGRRQRTNAASAARCKSIRKRPRRYPILKSGVVEGMAYTLYSDGSIEAQLPGGMVRFGSITELRNHIEKNG